MAKVKEQLASRGVDSIGTIRRAFKIFDDNGDCKLGKDEMYYGLTDYGCDVSQDKVATLFAAFDKNGDGVVRYDEFLVGLRGEMNEVRRAIVDKAY